MGDKKEFQKIIEELPKTLKSLLENELAAGNEIIEAGHSFSAPSNDIYIKLAKPLLTKHDGTKSELIFRERDSPPCSGEYSNCGRKFIIITPSLPEATHRKNSPKPPKMDSVSMLQRFEKSMEITYEKWHDGIGYDIDAIRSASPTELETIEQMLIRHNPRDWRDIEALAEINTESASEIIKTAITDPDPEVRIAVSRFAPSLVSDGERTQSLVSALHNAELYSGLSQALDDVEEYHPKEVREALLAGLLDREGDVAVLFAAMLFFIYGKAAEPFDMKQRPFFLRFNTGDREERMLAFHELCKLLNINPEKYLDPNKKHGK